MKGVVEVFAFGKKIDESSNLIVDKAGEVIADLMTISPSLSSIESASALLDTSNYTIQAISYGKANQSFQHNAYVIPTYNYFENTEDHDYSTWINAGCVVGTDEEEMPIYGEDTLPITGRNTNDVIVKYVPVQVSSWVFTGTDYTASFYVKNIDATESSVALFYQSANILQSSAAQLTLKWSSEDSSISSVAGIVGNYNYGVFDVGGGWWKVMVSLDYNLAANQLQEVFMAIYPQNLGTTYRGIRVYGPQFQLGSLATAYVKNTENPFTGLTKTQVGNRIKPLADGIIRVRSLMDASCGTNIFPGSFYPEGATYSGVYVSNPYLPVAPSPLDTQLQPSAIPLYSYLSRGIPYINNGQNLNMTASSNGGVIKDSLGHSIQVKKSGLLFGGFQTSTPRSWYVLSSLDSPDLPALSGSSPGNINVSGDCDDRGFVRFSTRANFYRLTEANISSTNAVEYRFGINRSDWVMTALYGGITEIGLWCIDIKESVRQGASAPFSHSVVNNPRKYRLFAKKSYTRNLMYLNDSPDFPVFTILPLIDGGTVNTALTLEYTFNGVWRLIF